MEDEFYIAAAATSSPLLSSDKSLEASENLQVGHSTSAQTSAVDRTYPRDSIESSNECKAEAESSIEKRKSVVRKRRTAGRKKKATVRKKKTPVRKKKKKIPITKVTSLVFFDLETTGLAYQIGKSNVQITEVSMFAVNRKEFEQNTYEDLRDIRVIQRLCLCTRPRSNVSSGAAAISGLNNENLMDQKHFDRDAAEAINLFLSRLPKPICLLAHNRNSYGFPLLKAEFSRLNMSLPSEIFIADTLRAFKALSVPTLPYEKICKSVEFTKNGNVSYSLRNLHLYFFNKNRKDCIALARVCHRMKDSILLWIDENCGTFDSVSSMW